MASGSGTVIAADTNVIVRLLTHDDEEQYERAYALFERERIFLATTVVLETEWVLRYAYGFAPGEVVTALRRLFGLARVELEEPGLVAQVLEWHSQEMDFADANSF